MKRWFCHDRARGHGVGGRQVQRRAVEAKKLDIYIADTEGGKAALFVSPSGQTLHDRQRQPGRSAIPIASWRCSADAGVKQLDYLDLHALSRRSRRRDAGAGQADADCPLHRSRSERRSRTTGARTFRRHTTELHGKAKHTVVKPGDRVPITGIDWRIVTAGGEVLKKPLPGGGRPNPACAKFAEERGSRRRRTTTRNRSGA